jgi:tetratricopeptide (TPR) repeat protein
MQIVAHLKHKIDRLTQQLASWSAARQGSASGEQEPAAERPFKMQQIIEQELWHYKAQELTHMLLVDTEAGLNTFSIMFDEATRSYTLRFRATLFTYIEPYLNMLPPEQRHVIESRRVEHLFDHGEYIQARQLAATLQEQHTFSPEQLVTMLIQQGNIEIRLGYLDQSVAHFDRALRICRMHSLNAELVRTLNARGWAYRNQGKHDQALTDYLEAYQLSLQVDDPEQTAWVLTNISFIGTLRGDRQAAYESCQTALKLWESSGSLRGKGAAYSTLGGFHVRFNEPDEAMHAYTQALDIFSREQDLDWLSLVRCGRAYAFQSLGEFDKAEEDLAWALEHGPVNLRPRILYSQGQISWSRGDLLLTRQKLEECRTFSQEIGDHFHDYKCFADLIELAWEFGEFDRWRTFAETLVQSYTNPAEADSIRLRASCLRKIGDLTMCEGDYDAALDFYKQGFPLLAEYEIHERYTIRSQMRQTDQRLRAHVPDATLHRLGHDMAQFWRSNMLLVVKYPEALLTFRDWERKGGIIEQPPLL